MSIFLSVDGQAQTFDAVGSPKPAMHWLSLAGVRLRPGMGVYINDVAVTSSLLLHQPLLPNSRIFVESWPDSTNALTAEMLAPSALPNPSKGSWKARAWAFGLIALKSLKSLKLIGLVTSLLLYSIFLTWQGAIVFVLGLVCHEYGHVWAMRRIGIQTSGFYLIPFVGGICSPNRPFQHRFEEAFTAAMGPVFGLACTPLCWGVMYGLTGSSVLANKAVGGLVLLNAFNLLPIVPMDGGRILRAVTASFHRTMGLVLIGAGIVGALVLVVLFHFYILLMIAAFACVELWSEIQRTHVIKSLDRAKALGWGLVYGALLAVAFGMLHITLPGLLPHLLRG